MNEKFPECIAETLIEEFEMFTHIHCATLFLVGSLFILINSFIPRWALLSRFKQT